MRKPPGVHGNPLGRRELLRQGFLSPFGEQLVAADGGDLQIVAVMPDGSLVAVAELVGHDGSEVTGIAFDPRFVA